MRGEGSARGGRGGGVLDVKKNARTASELVEVTELMLSIYHTYNLLQIYR